MGQINVDDLSGQHLDYYVQLAEGRIPDNFSLPIVDGMFTRYSDNWDDAGPIIERERIELRPESSGQWLAFAWNGEESQGPEPLVAAMRAFVKSKFGSEVDAMSME